MSKVAILQPYIFPYIGYFQLINAVDTFVFYDDVNFIKKGWVHRNSILINGEPNLFSIPCIKASQNKFIKDITVDSNNIKINKTLKNINIHYKKAPFYNDVFPVIEKIFESIQDNTKISELSISSVIEVCKYLGINKKIEISSDKYAQSQGLEKSERIMSICSTNEANVYINPKGGVELYSKELFKDNNIELKFMSTDIEAVKYKQFNDDFVPGLSIIDVMMFNSIEEIKDMLELYKLI